MRLDVHTHQLDTIWCNWSCLDMQLDISVTIVIPVDWCMQFLWLPCHNGLGLTTLVGYA